MSFGHTYSSSPVLAMQPQSAHAVPFDKPFLSHQVSSFGLAVSRSNQLLRTGSVAGCKRSRDEAAVNLDSPEKTVEPPRPMDSDESEDGWVFGPGMVLIKKSTGYVADASSQSGTWVEDKAAEEATRKAGASRLAQQRLAQERPSLRSSKSMRIAMAPAPAGTASRFPNAARSPAREVANPLTTSSDSIAQPVVDDFTMHLGIGWSRISSDEHIQAAARGWARYIENHYPVTDAKVRLESRGLQSYLVEANEGYFLFAENLRHGRLVSNNAERALAHLKSSPVIFDGPDTMEAAGIPKASDATTHELATLTTTTATATATATAATTTTAAPVSVEMDLS